MILTAGGCIKAYALHNCVPTRNLSFIDARCQAFVDIASIDAGKENAIAKLSTIIAPGEHIVTVGDGTNDIDMLQRFDGYAIAAGNSLTIAAVDDNRVVKSVVELIKIHTTEVFLKKWLGQSNFTKL